VLWTAAVVAVALLAVFLAWVLFVPAADWLAQKDIGNATGASLETARNNARGNLLALTAGIAGFGALLFTARNFKLTEANLTPRGLARCGPDSRDPDRRKPDPYDPNRRDPNRREPDPREADRR
jgi:hypothetical protein